MLDGHWSSLAQIAEACELSREQVSEAAKKGAVWRRKGGAKSARLRRIRNPDTEAESGDTLFINYDRKVLDQIPQLPKLVSDQGNYSVWYKPSGTLSQGSKWSDHCTITETAASAHGKKCLLVHRLDRAACGLMVLAHTPNACKALAAMFEKREVLKIYRATVYGKVNKDLPWEIKKPIDGKAAHTVVLSAESLEKPDQSESEPEDKSEARSEPRSKLRVDIKTGRKHQIRNHLSGEGFPVVGDRLFDADRKHECDLQLVATELHFTCPFSGKLKKVQLEDSLLSPHK